MVNAIYSETIQTTREDLLTHPVYTMVNSPERIKIFMKHHVFAVWDYMNVLKRLQRQLTSLSIPWIPRAHAEYVRYINEMVLTEEADEDGQGGYASHFEMYIQAMDEAGADITPIQQYVEMIIAGYHPLESLYSSEIPPTVADFVRQSLELSLNGKPHEVAAWFIFGRDDLIPDMFATLLRSLEQQGIHNRFTSYLRRHLAVDGRRNGPLAEKLLQSLCGNDPLKREQAYRIAQSALEARLRLWDGITDEIKRTGV
ncbi:DUF3050 domain-containing protein [Laceyella sacchari]|jgi:hypothetical protein|uniref:DUF3050 domain-containing protein n=1 Tax=Laceyella sacchari TaxID=37482 RepID=A0ABY5U3D1_LACSH|nr:DUF3050 domain-containing protein [Laceyella sacchari]TCW38816.1 DUF3050 family protein [Laceyella sacchari]UWE03155.1 DUF3050 domain-containing protein [Laceyella sacchari]